MSVAVYIKNVGPTSSIVTPNIACFDEVGDILDDVEERGQKEQLSTDMTRKFSFAKSVNPDQENSAESGSSDYSEEDNSVYESESQLLTVMRQSSVKKWKDRDINDLFKELEAEKRFLKTDADVTNIRKELQKIKDAGGHVVNLSKKVKGFERVLKSAAKDKFEQEKEMLELRNEISELKQRNGKLEDIIHNKAFEGGPPSSNPVSRFRSRSTGYGAPIKTTYLPRSATNPDQSTFNALHNPMRTTYIPPGIGVSIKFNDQKTTCHNVPPIHEMDCTTSASPTGSVSSEHSSISVTRKMKEQEVLIASLHRKIDFLEFQQKDKEVDTLKAQVSHLSDVLEKLIKGFQKASKNNPLVTRQLESLKHTLPNAQINEIKNLSNDPQNRGRSYSVPEEDDKRHIWWTGIEADEFKGGPVSFLL